MNYYCPTEIALVLVVVPVQATHEIITKQFELRTQCSPQNKLSMMNSTLGNSTSSINSVHLVLQRYRSCRLLLNEIEWVTQGPVVAVGDTSSEGNQSEGNTAVAVDDHHSHCGLLIYISFAKNTTTKSCWDAAEVCCNVPLLTNGLWGDTTSELFSLKQILTTTLENDENKNGTDKHCNNSVLRPFTSVTIVPQANLICSMKRQGTSIQYHNQISKEDGRYYYELFVHFMRASLYEYNCIRTKQEIPAAFLEWKLQYLPTTTEANSSIINTTTLEPTKFDPSIPPLDIFRTSTSTMYGSYDTTTGVPITDIHNVPLTKSALKKLRKIQEIHRTKHEKWFQQQQSTTPSQPLKENSTKYDDVETKLPKASTATTTTTIAATVTTIPSLPNQKEPVLLSSLLCSVPPSPPILWMDGLVVGTFGKRQGIEIISDMGPFCHTVQI
jgi:D-Tyr-tRNA(Tyr) deacylase